MYAHTALRDDFTIRSKAYYQAVSYTHLDVYKRQVLMSVYYKEKPKYLQQALESIWDKQTLKPDEIILVEDGKLTPELYQTIEKWEKKLNGKLKRIPLRENQGLAKALNTGIKHCSGEYIARICLLYTSQLGRSMRMDKIF